MLEQSAGSWFCVSIGGFADGTIHAQCPPNQGKLVEPQQVDWMRQSSDWCLD